MADAKLAVFSPEALDWQTFEGKAISVAPALTKSAGAPLSAYFARFGQGETADLPAPYAEIWMVIKGALTLRSNGIVVTARQGEFLYVPADTPGDVTADAETELACVSVPPH